MNNAVMQYINGRNIAHFLVIDLNRPPPVLLPGEPQPRLRGPFLPPRYLPMGREHSDVVCFSHAVFTLMIPHEVRTWCAMELLHELHEQLRCLRLRSLFYEMGHLSQHGFKLLTP